MPGKIAEFARAPLPDKINQIHAFLVFLKTAIYYRYIFAEIGKKSLIYKPLLLSGTQFVHIGEGTLIRPGARIEAILLDPKRPPRIDIGSNVNIEQNVHLICSSKLVIGDDVSIAPNCGILDTSHPVSDATDSGKIGGRLNHDPTPVEVGSNTLIGMGVVILPGVRIGSRCVIGANSTVTHDIPAYSIAVGSPAEVVRQYDFETQEWAAVRRL